MRPEPCTFLEWDSDFFGVRIARVNESTLNPISAAEVDAWCTAQRIDCLYLLAESDHQDTVRAAESSGYGLVDIRMTFETALRPTDADLMDSSLRAAVSDDLPALKQIARRSYTLSRFYFDPHFPPEACDLLYEIWIQRSVEGRADSVLVLAENGLIKGFISLHKHDTKGEIGLVGVAENARGEGVGAKLVNGARAWFAAHGCTSASVVTQGRNIAAQRLYQRAGFITQSVQLWYHKWYD